MTPRLPLLVLSLCLAAGAAFAQQGYNVRGEVRDGAFPQTPRFDNPLVTVFVKPAASDSFVSGKNLSVERQSGAFRFQDFIGGFAITNHWAIITVQAGENGEFVVPDPNASRAELTPDLAGGPIDFAINLRHRSEIAEGYRRSVLDALRSPQITPDLLEGANNAALSAVELDPTLNNFLLVARVTDAAIRRDLQDFGGAVLDPETLALNEGFEALSPEDRWKVQSQFLDTLSRSEATRAQAIATGTAMLDSLPLDDDEALSQWRIVHVFLTMSRLYAAEGDCMSLAGNAARGIELADRLRMDWSSRRTLLLDWADCLERLSGAGTGRTEEAFIAEAAANESLRGLWSDFAEGGAGAYETVALSTVDSDRRLRALVERARAIRDHQ
ncbi:MAG: hypothetical protein MUE98_05455 [Rhodobacteraceae bacterium]|nr:hypothetical protein [Paracoccaceae bacterium]